MTLIEHLARHFARTACEELAVEENETEVIVERSWKNHLPQASAVIAALGQYEAADNLVFPALDRAFGSKVGSDSREFKGDRSMWQTLWMRMLDQAETPLASPKARPKVAYCQPDYGGEILSPKYLLRFEDASMGDLLFEDETEARERFAAYSIGWNCFLFGTLPRDPRQQPSDDDLARRAAVVAFGLWLSDNEQATWTAIYAQWLRVISGKSISRDNTRPEKSASNTNNFLDQQEPLVHHGNGTGQARWSDV